jgi:hypothetical protein
MMVCCGLDELLLPIREKLETSKFATVIGGRVITASDYIPELVDELAETIRQTVYEKFGVESPIAKQDEE